MLSFCVILVEHQRLTCFGLNHAPVPFVLPKGHPGIEGIGPFAGELGSQQLKTSKSAPSARFHTPSSLDMFVG